MLTYFITNKKYFSTELLNDRIASFAYTTTEAKDKPSPVKHNVITKGGPLSQTCKFNISTKMYVFRHVDVYSMQLHRCGH